MLKKGIFIQEDKKVKNKGVRILIIVLVILIIVAGGVLAYKIVQDKKETEPVTEENNVIVAPVE